MSFVVNQNPSVLTLSRQGPDATAAMQTVIAAAGAEAGIIDPKANADGSNMFKEEKYKWKLGNIGRLP